MTSLSLDVAVEALPELMRRAVEAVPRAILIEVLPEGALIGRRTNFALTSETTRFSFHAVDPSHSEVRAESTNAGMFALVPMKGIVADTGRAVLDALEREARTPPRPA